MGKRFSLEELKKRYIGFHNRKLTVLDIFEKPKWDSRYGKYYMERWAHCKCDCGNERDFRLSIVIHDDVWSCGCLRDQAAKRNAELARKVLFDKYVYNRRGNTYMMLDNGVVQVDSHSNPDIKFYVDNETWEWFKFFTWSVSRNGYVYTTANYRPYAYHDIIIASPPGYVRDHIDRNRSNNLYQNLRVTTFRGNTINKDYSTRNKSGTVGVQKQGNKWQVSITTKEGLIWESYDTEEEAVQRRKQLEEQHHIVEELVPVPRLILPDGSLNYRNFRFDWYPPTYEPIWQFLGINLVPSFTH